MYNTAKVATLDGICCRRGVVKDVFITYLIFIRKGEITMIISEIKIRKTFDEGALRAIVSVTIDDCFAVHEIKVIQGSERLFIAMPARKDDNGVFRDTVHPIYPEARKYFEDTILEAYRNYIELEKVLTNEGDKSAI